MKKSYQIWRDVIIPRNDSSTGLPGEVVISEQLKENFAKATGFFIVPSNDLSKDLSGLTIFLKISQNEILPKGTDASIVSFNGNVAREQVVYDFSKENIPARSSDFELTLSNYDINAKKVNIYVVLENE